jgi:thymidylate kinase
MDKTIFIDSDKEDIVKRASDREKLDVMDNVFLNKMDYVLSNYRSIINWDWTQKYCNPVSLMNNDFEQLVDQAYAIIEEVISQQDWN